MLSFPLQGCLCRLMGGIIQRSDDVPDAHLSLSKDLRELRLDMLTYTQMLSTSNHVTFQYR